MVQHIWITYLQLRMNENPYLTMLLKEQGINLYLFGSAIYKDLPEDLDVLMVYPINQVNISFALDMKNILLEYLIHISLLKVDLLLLSSEEETEVNFIEREKAIILDF